MLKPTRNNSNANNNTEKNTTTIKKSSPPSIKPSEGPFKCEECGQGFKSASSKGGHKRSYHPGASEKYKHKMEVRNRRAKQRERHQKAKEILQSKKLLNQATKPDIVEIKQIKTLLVKLEGDK